MPTRERKEYHAARLVKYVDEYKKVRPRMIPHAAAP
jgi:hypothetical protein